ncbi:acetyl-CoA synthetase-like protein [Athelia psychrophila]|uniref:Acetyl-CoA synthetase-like protein n=1 Tax=Athelia psychrophila TaxID=1759441 RepID=A0A166CDS9_9AGAM|nr:acetyl-CoA synthetase-like protein [Fibularhizoctonia sp. CBS 109695]
MSTQISAVYPPMDGTIRPAALVDFHLEHNPTHKVYVYSEAPGALVEISFLEFGRAAHRAGHLLRPKRSGPENEVVAFIANVDVLLYQTLVAGMMRAGLVPFPIAPRNSAEAVVSILQKAGCHRILTTSTTLGNLIAQIKSLTSADSALTFEDAPTVSQCYPYLGQETPSHPFTPYPTPQAPLDLDQLLFYLHSSGSTGFPKPIPQTNRTFLGGLSLVNQVTSSTSVAPFWLGGMHLALFRGLSMGMQLFVPLATGITVAIYPPISLTDHDTPPAAPTTDTAMEHSKRTGVTALVAVPSFIETSWRMLEADFARRRDTQGPFARKIGDALSADGVTISCLYGATEFVFVSALFGGAEEWGPDDWSYVRFDEKVHVRWARQADGTFESQFLDAEAHKLRVLNLPDVKGYASNDLWEPHPTKANLWRIIGKEHGSGALGDRDHVIADGQWRGYLWAWAESGQSAHRAYSRGGATSDVVEFRNITWPIVEEANKEAPLFSRIFKEVILVTDGSKPLPRVAKHTVAKKAAMKLYAAEIDALAANVQPPATWEENDIEAWLGVQASDIHSAQFLNVDADIFLQGFDSTDALRQLVCNARITGTLRSSSDPQASKAVQKVTQNVVFSHATIRQFSAHIAQMVSGADAGPASATLAIEKMIEQYSVVLLKGFTGGWSPSHLCVGGTKRGTFPDKVQYDASTAVGGGYGEAKYVCERLLAKSGPRATSFRIGQISGGEPSSDTVLGGFVAARGRSLAGYSGCGTVKAATGHCPGHCPSRWSTIVTSVATALHRAGVAGHCPPLAPLTERFERLEQRAQGADADARAKIPALKLLAFFQGMLAADEAAPKSGRTNREVGMASLSTVESQVSSCRHDDGRGAADRRGGCPALGGLLDIQEILRLISHCTLFKWKAQ